MYRRLALVQVGLEELGLTHLKNQALMLRCLTGAADVRPLEVLAEAAEPLRGYERSNQGITYSTLSPYTRFVDACFPESLVARAFQTKVGRYLETRDPALAEEIRATLVRWKNNHPLVLPYLAASPALREVEPLSLALQSAAAAGLEALDWLASGKVPEKAWGEARKELLAGAGKPKAQAQLAIIPAVAKLVEACAAAAK
jgi:hexosaminidase